VLETLEKYDIPTGAFFPMETSSPPENSTLERALIIWDPVGAGSDEWVTETLKKYIIFPSFHDLDLIKVTCFLIIFQVCQFVLSVWTRLMLWCSMPRPKTAHLFNVPRAAFINEVWRRSKRPQDELIDVKDALRAVLKPESATQAPIIMMPAEAILPTGIMVFVTHERDEGQTVPKAIGYGQFTNDGYFTVPRHVVRSVVSSFEPHIMTLEQTRDGYNRTTAPLSDFPALWTALQNADKLPESTVDLVAFTMGLDKMRANWNALHIINSLRKCAVKIKDLPFRSDGVSTNVTAYMLTGIPSVGFGIAASVGVTELIGDCAVACSASTVNFEGGGFGSSGMPLFSSSGKFVACHLANATDKLNVAIPCAIVRSKPSRYSYAKIVGTTYKVIKESLYNRPYDSNVAAYIEQIGREEERDQARFQFVGPAWADLEGEDDFVPIRPEWTDALEPSDRVVEFGADREIARAARRKFGPLESYSAARTTPVVLPDGVSMKARLESLDITPLSPIVGIETKAKLAAPGQELCNPSGQAVYRCTELLPKPVPSGQRGMRNDHVARRLGHTDVDYPANIAADDSLIGQVGVLKEVPDLSEERISELADQLWEHPAFKRCGFRFPNVSLMTDDDILKALLGILNSSLVDTSRSAGVHKLHGSSTHEQWVKKVGVDVVLDRCLKMIRNIAKVPMGLLKEMEPETIADNMWGAYFVITKNELHDKLKLKKQTCSTVDGATLVGDRSRCIWTQTIEMNLVERFFCQDLLESTKYKVSNGMAGFPSSPEKGPELLDFIAKFFDKNGKDDEPIRSVDMQQFDSSCSEGLQRAAFRVASRNCHGADNGILEKLAIIRSRKVFYTSTRKYIQLPGAYGGNPSGSLLTSSSNIMCAGVVQVELITFYQVKDGTWLSMSDDILRSFKLSKAEADKCLNRIGITEKFDVAYELGNGEFCSSTQRYDKAAELTRWQNCLLSLFSEHLIGTETYQLAKAGVSAALIGHRFDDGEQVELGTAFSAEEIIDKLEAEVQSSKEEQRKSAESYDASQATSSGASKASRKRRQKARPQELGCRDPPTA
jgi:hypothetical protein